MKFEITNNETRNIITLNETTELSEFHQNEQGVPPPAQSASSSNDSSHDSSERLSPTQNEPSSSSTATLPSPPSPSTSPSAAITDSQRRRLESFTLYTPKNILLLFTLVNLVVYFDRGVPGSAIPYIRVDNDITGGAGKPPLTQTECGTLYSAFMFGFFIFNPICVALGGYFSSNRIILAGISAWCVAVICAGAAQSYTQLLVARAFTGIGESAYIAFSVTVLDDIAPPARRSLWLSIFYCTIPFGNAMGIAVNSLIASRSYGEGGTIAGWRMGFFLEAIPMAILVAFVTFLPNEYNVRVEDRGRVDWVDETNNNNNAESNGQQERCQNNNNEKHMNLPRAVYCLLTNENWVIFCSGYIVYTASLGALSFFAVSMLVQSNFDVTAIQASLLLGIATSAMGFIGSILGGKILDSLPGGSIGVPGLRNAASIMTASMILAIPCGFIALNASAFTTFCVFFIPAVFCAFVVTAPMASSILSVVPSNLRPYSVAVNTLAIHLLGDLESPWITGKLADAFDGGCNAFDSNRTLCERHSVAGGSCKFMTGSSSNEKTSCVNPDELFQAMRIVWMFMLLTLPSWGYLSWKFRNELIGVAAEEEETKKRALEK